MRIKSFCAAAIIVFFGVVPPASAAVVNLLTNGDFETGTLAGWTTVGLSAGNNFYLTSNGANGPVSGLPTQVNPGGGSFVALGDIADRLRWSRLSRLSSDEEEPCSFRRCLINNSKSKSSKPRHHPGLFA